VQGGRVAGGEDVRRFVLRASREGDYTLRFVLKRRWEAPPLRTRDVNVAVRTGFGAAP